MAAPMDIASGGQNQNLVDDLESSLLNCLSLLTTQEQINVQDSEETKTSIENAMQKFLELSRQTEAFFLRKRMLISFQKPETYINDDVNDLKIELARKEALLEKHADRLKRCQMILQQQATAAGQAPQPAHPTPPQSVMQQQASHPVPQQSLMSQASQLPQYSSHHMQQMGSQGPGPGLPQYQGYSGSMQGQAMPGPHPPSMQSHQMPPRQQPPPSYPQGPLAYLEQTTSNIGLPDRR